MYIALISLHSLIMVVFHFLNCFEDDWTSEYFYWILFFVGSKKRKVSLQMHRHSRGV